MTYCIPAETIEVGTGTREDGTEVAVLRLYSSDGIHTFALGRTELLNLGGLCAMTAGQMSRA